MRPSRTASLPTGKQWVYEMKYDGYRAYLSWDGNKASLTSKSGQHLDKQFPEILETASRFFPTDVSFKWDGELIVFENHGRADFYSLQSRHRRRSDRKIAAAATSHPAAFLAFDCLVSNQQSITHKTLVDRKQILKNIVIRSNLPLTPEPQAIGRIQFLPYRENLDKTLEKNRLFQGEGIVAKRRDSIYEKERTQYWLKYKTPCIAECFIMSYNPANDYFDLGVFDGNEVVSIGNCSHGLSKREKTALIKTMKNNGTWDTSTKLYRIEPSIVVEVSYTTRKNSELREPRFTQLLLQNGPSLCTVTKLQMADLRIPKTVDVTHPNKILWPDNTIYKYDYIRYVRILAPFVLPFLQNRALTVVRYPHGILGESFFQKDCPDYSPDFVDTKKIDNNDFIVCNKLETLLWLGNQLALEWHVPFQRINTNHVDEIVFDLDPPDTDHFYMAIEGALHLKELLTECKLESFVKFSGNKGVQVYIPLPENTYTWEETGLITKTIGNLLKEKHPNLFTLERRRNKRNNKLYLDIPQHAQGKTIIAPYSLRGKKEPLAACPLFWDELSPSLERTIFTMEHVVERLILYGCPFQAMNGEHNREPIDHLLTALKNR